MARGLSSVEAALAVPVERGPSGGRAVRAETLAPVGLAVTVARSCLRVVFAGSRAVAPRSAVRRAVSAAARSGVTLVLEPRP